MGVLRDSHEMGASVEQVHYKQQQNVIIRNKYSLGQLFEACLA